VISQDFKIREEFPKSFRRVSEAPLTSEAPDAGSAMNPFARLTWQAALAGRWTARILGSLMVLFGLAFIFGEGPPPILRMTAREQLYALGMGSLFLGLVVAWFWEGWGGLLSVLGWGLLAVLARKPAWDMPFSIPAAMGFLHLLCWSRLRGPAPPPEAVNWATRPGVRTLFLFMAAFLGTFLLLCANEIFGQPPIMAPSGPLPAGIVGTWHASLTTASGRPLPDEIPVVFTIRSDGSVSGTVGNAALTNGQLLPNRSWFGRLMHWRTPYQIRGILSHEVHSYGGTAGDRFTAALSSEESELDGALFLSHPGTPKPLGLHLKRR
jgi:hypothetical protein